MNVTEINNPYLRRAAICAVVALWWVVVPTVLVLEVIESAVTPHWRALMREWRDVRRSIAEVW